MKKIFTYALALSMGLSFSSCDDDSVISEIFRELFDGTDVADSGETLVSKTGWLESKENTDEIEDEIRLNDADGNSNFGSTLPSSVDLQKYLPAIGDQGQYGTCVAWAVAYNFRSFVNAKETGSKSTTFSPKDLFWAIPSSYKGSDCNGTSFEPAFDVLVSRGVATMGKVPYTNLNGCSSKPTSDMTQDANNYKIKSYREINLDKSTIKKYLASNNLVVFGAKLGDEFMYSDGSTVLTRQTSFNYTGMHAYHAMVCCGYDDNKGSHGAFKVVNSWGSDWGSNGIIWVDQDFFVGGDFAYCAFIGHGLKENEVSIDEETNEVQNTNSGADLLAYYCEDYDYENPEWPDDSADPTWRECAFNVYNAGTDAISSSKNWANCLIYYNVYNANDYEILLLDFYTNAYGKKGDFDDLWDNQEAYNALGVRSQGYAWSNVDIPAGWSVVDAVKGKGECFYWPYKWDNNVNGKYYVCLIADAFDGVAESDEDNNYYYITAADGGPITIRNGVIQSTLAKKAISKSNAKPRQGQKSASPTARTEQNVNAYTPDEISKMITEHRKNGTLKAKAMAWANSEMGQKVMAKQRR